MKNHHFSNSGLQNKVNPDSITPNTEDPEPKPRKLAVIPKP